MFLIPTVSFLSVPPEKSLCLFSWPHRLATFSIVWSLRKDGATTTNPIPPEPSSCQSSSSRGSHPQFLDLLPKGFLFWTFSQFISCLFRAAHRIQQCPIFRFTLYTYWSLISLGIFNPSLSWSSAHDSHQWVPEPMQTLQCALFRNDPDRTPVGTGDCCFSQEGVDFSHCHPLMGLSLL